MTDHKHLKRLARVWVKEPVFFITTGTHQRQPILANAKIVSILVEEWTQALQLHGWAVGRYVVMPNHVHFFCAPVSSIGGPVAGSAIPATRAATPATKIYLDSCNNGNNGPASALSAHVAQMAHLGYNDLLHLFGKPNFLTT